MVRQQHTKGASQRQGLGGIVPMDSDRAPAWKQLACQGSYERRGTVSGCADHGTDRPSWKVQSDTVDGTTFIASA